MFLVSIFYLLSFCLCVQKLGPSHLKRKCLTGIGVPFQVTIPRDKMLSPSEQIENSS